MGGGRLVLGLQERGQGWEENEWRLPVGTGDSRGLGVPAAAGRTRGLPPGALVGVSWTVKDSYLQVGRGEPRETAVCRAAPRRSFIHLRNRRWRARSPGELAAFRLFVFPVEEFCFACFGFGGGTAWEGARSP